MRPPRRTPQQQRTRQAAIVSRAILVAFKEIKAAYQPKQRNIGRMFQDVFVAMAIRLQDERNRGPSSQRELSRLTALPRTNVRRALESLMRQKIVRKHDHGYSGKGVFLIAQIDRRHLRRIVGAIVGAAEELRQVQKNAWGGPFRPSRD